MARTSSITMPSMVRIVGRAPAVDEKVLCLFVFFCYWQVCTKRSHAGIVFLLSGPKMGFSPAGATGCPKT